jgi:hypothetical protein
MLSPHEIATLMLVGSAPEQVEISRAELDTLLDSRFVELERGAGDWRRLTLTAAGQRVLDMIARLGERMRPAAVAFGD